MQRNSACGLFTKPSELLCRKEGGTMKKILLVFCIILGVIGIGAGNSYARWHGGPWGPWGGGGPWGGPWHHPGIFWGGPAIVVDPWPRPYYPPPPPVVVQEPPVYIQQPPPENRDYWYYCESPRGYYPYVKECPGGWMKVLPQPAPPDR